MHRFFLPPDSWNSPAPELDPGETHHAHTVLRLGTGDRVTVFDGAGREATAVIESIDRNAARLRLGPATRSAPPACSITLAQAVPKGKNMDLIVQKAVELGARRIAPILSERTIIDLPAEERERRREKWSATALEACKQCGQNWLPEVLTPRDPKAHLESSEPTELALIASLQPDARPIKNILAEFVETHQRRPGSAAILIGPEGDFTPAELALAKSHGCVPVTLGPIILRTETAAIYSLSVLAHELFS